MKAHEELIFSLGVVPVVTLNSADAAVPLARALTNGGLPIAEITFRTPAAAESIRRVRAEMPDMLVGAGTISSIALAKEALAAGSSFLVTPGFNPEVVAWCVENKVSVYPGCTTASEVEAAMNLGLSVVKFFPAEQSGGLAKIKALCAPYPSMRFMPTGGISLKNLPEYLAFSKIFACGGSFMVSDDLIANARWGDVATLSAEAVKTAQGLELARIGFVEKTSASASGLESTLTALFGQANGFEVVTSEDASAGHISYSATNLERSCCFFAAKGFASEAKSAVLDAAGTLVSIRLQEKIGGFSFYLSKKKR